MLEISFGTGYCLKRIAELTSQKSRAYGIDISSCMVEMTKRRLEKAGPANEVELLFGDAASMPFDVNNFDVVFMSFVLEVFNTPEIPRVLEQIKNC